MTKADEVFLSCIHPPFLVAKAVRPHLSRRRAVLDKHLEFFFPQVCYSESNVTSVTVRVVTPVSTAENALLQRGPFPGLLFALNHLFKETISISSLPTCLAWRKTLTTADLYSEYQIDSVSGAVMAFRGVRRGWIVLLKLGLAQGGTGRNVLAPAALWELLLIRHIVTGEDCWGAAFFLTVISINCP